MSTKTTYCWLDCDPGHDDAFAILLAGCSDRIKLLGVSTVAGNQSIEKTSKNALNIFNIFGFVDNTENAEDSAKLKYPIIKGSPKPLIRTSVICDEIHGESGLETRGSVKFPSLSDSVLKCISDDLTSTCHFTCKMSKHLRAAPEPVTIIATGPLTNIALLLVNQPDIVKHIDRIVLMGGACGVGNTGPVAEFNIQVDPESAHIVFESGVRIVMIPLEVTHTALVNQQVLEKIGSLSSRFSQLMTDLLLFFRSTYKEVFFMDDPPLHDPCAVAFVIDETLFQGRLMRVDVEVASSLSYGQTVCDMFGMSKKPKNVHVCLKMDVERFWNLVQECLHKANAASPVNIVV